MSRDTSSRWAAAFGALAVTVTGVLLAFRGGSPLACLAVVPILVGLVGSSFGRTWGVFATVGGAALMLVAFGVHEVPGWAAMTAVGGLAVVLPGLFRAFRFDAVAASAWMVLAGLSGSAGALAWDELDEPPVAAAPDLDKPVAHDGYGFEVRWESRQGDRPCHHRGRWRGRGRW
ncbi:MAG: hypothetical protein H6719_25610 [Sandaracinaceae bacterium]|nr:hypothetical protein [Sandaracinaceae bacterium]